MKFRDTVPICLTIYRVFQSCFTEKPDIKTTYFLSIVLQKLFKMFAILFDTPSATFSYAINNGGA